MHWYTSLLYVVGFAKRGNLEQKIIFEFQTLSGFHQVCNVMSFEVMKMDILGKGYGCLKSANGVQKYVGITNV